VYHFGIICSLIGGSNLQFESMVCCRRPRLDYNCWCFGLASDPRRRLLLFGFVRTEVRTLFDHVVLLVGRHLSSMFPTPASQNNSQWFFWGYSLVFSRTGGRFMGNLDNIGFKGVLAQENGYIPDILYAFFQGMFGAFTPALVIGPERGRILPCIVFLFVWATLVYDPIASWTWNPNGWAAQLGVLDFAGGTPVHITSGASALAFAWLLSGPPIEPQVSWIRPPLILGTQLYLCRPWDCVPMVWVARLQRRVSSRMQSPQHNGVRGIKSRCFLWWSDLVNDGLLFRSSEKEIRICLRDDINHSLADECCSLSPASSYHSRRGRRNRPYRARRSCI